MIDYAVLTCVDKCNKSDLPVTCLADYLISLKAAGWDDESLGDFQRAVLVALRKPQVPVMAGEG